MSLLDLIRSNANAGLEPRPPHLLRRLRGLDGGPLRTKSWRERDEGPSQRRDAPPCPSSPKPGGDDSGPGEFYVGSTTGEPELEFDHPPPSDYVQIDRIGMRAVNLAAITDRDARNGR